MSWVADNAGQVFGGGLWDVFDGKLLGGDAKDAAKDASRAQAASADKAIALQRESRDLARADLQPFVNFGQDQINPLLQMLTPEGQSDYARTNPMFQAALESVNRSTLANQAARGKLGSGDTLQALTDNYMATAMPHVQAHQNSLFNAVNLGQSSAAGQANTALTTGNSIADLTTQKGNVVASGIVGAQGARQQAINNLLGLGGQLGSAAIMSGGGGGAAGGGIMSAFSDSRLKENIEKIGADESGNIYEFSYRNIPGRFVGRIAQELRGIHPDAVSVHESGYLQVSEEFRARAI